MKKLKILLTLGSAVATFSFLNSAIQINQQVNAQGEVVQANFQENIVAKAFDRYTGTFYVGTGATNETYTIAKAGRTDSGFIALANAEPFNGDGAQWIAKNTVEGRMYGQLFGMLKANGTEATHLVAMNEDENDDNNTKIYTIKLNDSGATINQSPELNTANGGAIQGALGNSVLRLATGRDTTNNAEKVFVRVYPSGGATHSSNDGAAYSGVACLTLDTNTDNLALANANAIELDVTSEILGANSGGRASVATAQVEDMYWDYELQKLYVGLNVTSNNNGANSFCNAIVKASLNAAGQLQAFEMVTALPAGEADPGADTETDNVFIVKQNLVYGSAPVARINKIRTMKTSTGLKYLIANGNVGRITNGKAGSLVNALRLDENGNIVKNNTNGDALNVNWRYVDLLPTTVGGEAVPFGSFPLYFISDMEVIGDTVYVSFKDTNRNQNNDPGVWASSALFDNNGVIIGWTAWERVFTSNQSKDVDYADKPYFFSVDGKTGQLWQVVEDYTTLAPNPRVVERTKISTSGFAATSLQTQLRRDLADGCTCVLDLPKGTPGLGSGINADNSIVFFGGIEKVAFAQTKSGHYNTVTTSFDEDSYIKTDLPAGAGVVRCLGYSRKALGGDNNLSQGYFFAGTDKGLYVWAKTADPDAGTGFNTAANGGLTTMQAAPFDGTFSWQKMATNNITGAISSIESDGLNIFVVEQDTTVKNSAISRIWKIVLGNDVTTMERNTTKIAESGSSEIPENAIITGLQLITDSDGQAGSHYGVISTNAGIYLSNESLDALGPNNNWVLVDGSKAYHSCYSPKRVTTVDANQDGANHNVWGIALADDSRGLGYFQNSVLQQFGFNNDQDAWGATPANFTNGNLDVDPQSPLEYINRTTSFWTDGGRRFYARFDARENINNSLRSLPYYAQEWAMTHPESFLELSSISRIYWIENISALGMVLAGTDDGVISLVE